MTERLTFEQEQEIRDRLASVTPWPWKAEDSRVRAPYSVWRLVRNDSDPLLQVRFKSLLDIGRWAGFKRWEDAEFTANAPADMAALFAELDAVRAEQDRLKELLERAQWTDWDTDGDRCCPLCFERRQDGHDPDCEMVAILGDRATVKEQDD